MSRILFTLVFLFLLWRLFAPAEPDIPRDRASIIPAINTEPVTPGLDPGVLTQGSIPLRFRLVPRSQKGLRLLRNGEGTEWMPGSRPGMTAGRGSVMAGQRPEGPCPGHPR